MDDAPNEFGWKAAEKRVARFPCVSCGAEVVFAPGTGAVRCPYCHAENTIEAEGTVEELDLRPFLEKTRDDEARDEHYEHACTACGARVRTEANVASDVCPFCGTSFVADAEQVRTIPPGGVLPFKVTRDDAMSAYRTWLSKRWFAPSDLNKRSDLEARLKGIYLPYWTFDIDVTTQYTGQRGDHYWVTQTYTTMVNGRSVVRTRQVRKTRWRRAAGVVRNFFDDALIPASSTLPDEVLHTLEPWDLPAVEPYDDRYLAGFRAEAYTVPLNEGFSRGVARVRPGIESSIRRDIGGDVQRIATQADTFHDLTFKHLLLPLWIAAYRYKDKPYRVVINARTGEVTGSRPWSVWKISGAVVGGLVLIGLAVVLVAVLQR